MVMCSRKPTKPVGDGDARAETRKRGDEGALAEAMKAAAMVMCSARPMKGRRAMWVRSHNLEDAR